SDDDENARHAAFVLTESLLGEEAMDRWVGAVGVEPASRPGPRLLGGAEPAADDWLALDGVQPAFAAAVAAVKGELPPAPWYEVDLEQHEWAGFDLEPEEGDDRGRADLITGITPFTALTEATLGGPFRSERFSRFGET